MAEEIVKVSIGPDGKVAIEVEGIAGTGCLEETEDLVRALGGEVESQEMTAEAYVEPELVEAEQEQQAQGW